MIDVLKELEKRVKEEQANVDRQWIVGDAVRARNAGSQDALRDVLKIISGMRGKMSGELGGIDSRVSTATLDALEKAHRQAEIDKAVNEALNVVMVEVDGRRIFGAAFREDALDAIRRARPKAKKEEEKVAGMDVVEDPTIPEGVIELRHNGKLKGKIVNVGKEEKPTVPKFSKGKVVRVFGEIRKIANADPVWGGGEWDYLIERFGWVHESHLSFVCEEKHPEPKFRVGQRVRCVDSIGEQLGEVVETHNGRRSAAYPWYRVRLLIGPSIVGWYQEYDLRAVESTKSKPKFQVGKTVEFPEKKLGRVRRVELDHLMNEWWYDITGMDGENYQYGEGAIKEPSTQKVTDEFEIGSGEECGPCMVRRWRECSVFRKILCVEGIERPFKFYRCKECLAKWPGNVKEVVR